MVPDNELAGFYNSLDVFCFPTGIEGYGLPAVEAMACGKPVMVLQDAIIPEEIKSRCVVVDNFGEGLYGRLMYDRESNMAFARQHSWHTCVSQYIELYTNIVEGK
jgi:glycosyltransferase involved in cell wall biosynthesis